ncbi:hypothetical protein [Synechococcus sp. CC9902]|uniref:hypothetical protein n=1 Tax=Synechococcus sp. (strain CC9902) TaxID=316279 RepID=UPI0012E9EDDA|nr:hypothetical protein [Synechococcus sp. CC9902]
MVVPRAIGGAGRSLHSELLGGCLATNLAMGWSPADESVAERIGREVVLLFLSPPPLGRTRLQRGLRSLG